MGTKAFRVFLDTSVIFAVVLSETGGSRAVFRLGELGLLELVIGPTVLRECEAVVRRKASGSLPTLAQLLDLGRVEICKPGTEEALEQARCLVAYGPDAVVLAEAIAAEPDWFVTHDKAHFLGESVGEGLPFRVGTPGDLIQGVADQFFG